MDYFRIRQDKQYLNAPNITNVRDIVIRRKDVSIQNASKIEDVSVGFSNIRNPVDFIDVLDSQLFLVSNEVKKIFAIYEPAMIFKEICVVNGLTDEYGRYFLPLFPELNCLSEESVVSPDRSCVKRLVMCRPQSNFSIFKAAGLMTDVVMIRLDVAESLLRRGINKLTMERVKIAQC